MVPAVMLYHTPLIGLVAMIAIAGVLLWYIAR